MTASSDKTAEPKSGATAKKPATRPAAKTSATSAAAAARPATGGGAYWVQVGAFRDEESAKRLIAKLREQNFKVEETVRRRGSEPAPPPAAAPAPTPPERSTAAAGGDQYDVFVSGASAADLNRRLSAKGLAAEPSAGGLVIRPSLPLRDAVALSKDLAVEGFKVQVRRAGSTEAAKAAPRPPAPTPSASTSGGGETLYRVRVGSFPDRAAAVTALRELEGKGYKGYIARGDE